MGQMDNSIHFNPENDSLSQKNCRRQKNLRIFLMKFEIINN